MIAVTEDKKEKRKMLPIILDVPIILDKETYDETSSEIKKIGNPTKADHTYWTLNEDANGNLILPSTAVFWLFFWAETKGKKKKAPQVFEKIFDINYEDFAKALKLTRPDFKTEKGKRDKDPVRRKLKGVKNFSDETLEKIIEELYDTLVSSKVSNKIITEELEYQDKIARGLLGLTDEDVDNKIKEVQGRQRKMTGVSYSRKQRDRHLMELYKRKHHYECQFCRTQIVKSNGLYYIEACHIKAVKDDGDDNENNILVLCPNCHKEFDYGKREKEKWEENIYSVTVNDKNYEINFTLL
jgi:5-methylcytosine-specific restriction endonuclease McrA